MESPEEVREELRRYGRLGGLVRAFGMSREARIAVARRAATARWIRSRFGTPDFTSLGLPGGDLVDAGLADLAEGKFLSSGLVDPSLFRSLVDSIPGSEFQKYPALSKDAVLEAVNDFLEQS